jgi:heme-degrading monooxygenase HmoA
MSYAVIFTSKQSSNTKGYASMAKKIEDLAKLQKGFLGIESAKDGIGITVSYWESLNDIREWKLQSEHLVAQHAGKSLWYDWYKVRICKIEREYSFVSPK